MKKLSNSLYQAIDFAEPKLRAVTEQDSLAPALRGGWSRRQLVAHLVDSAANNHIRFLRASLEPSIELPRYDQEGNIRIQSPNAFPWSRLLDLFVAYNRYLAHVIAQIPAVKRNTPCRLIPYEPVTLEFLANDYVTHLLHHLSQISIVPPPHALERQ